MPIMNASCRVFKTALHGLRRRPMQSGLTCLGIVIGVAAVIVMIEIGLRMAVGARSKDILRQFPAEAVILCLFCGIAGILLGSCLSPAVQAILHWQPILSSSAMAAAFAVSAGVGVVFGFYPSWQASRLNPIEALRYE
jgi:ABC-type antimicrobial peptide transport system permease subunit